METIAFQESRLSRLGFGGCPIGGYGWGKVDDDKSAAAIHTALDKGINFFDTADTYGLGHSERILSQSLGKHRHEVVIASKFGVRQTADGRTIKDIRPSYLRSALESSLKRLRLECLPLYYIHWPDGITPIEDAIAELELCRQEGKIGSIGISNFTPDELRRACKVAPIAFAQIQYSLVDRTAAEDLLVVSNELKVPLVTWGSLAQGLLTGKFNSQTKFNSEDRRARYDNFQGEKFLRNLSLVNILQGIARRLEMTPSQIAMRWLLDTPGVESVLFGAKTPRQVEENILAAGDWRLSDEDYQRLKSHSSSKHCTTRKKQVA